MNPRTYLVAPEEWMLRGLCRTMDTDLFFPRVHDPDRRADRAKAVCHQCPVSSECLDYALRTHQRYGIWGGWSMDTKRRRIRADAGSR